MTGDSAAPEFRWPLIVALGALSLVRPAAGILGVTDGLPGSGFVLTLLVMAVWIGAVVLRGVPNPFVTLVLVGGASALFTMATVIAVLGGFPGPGLAAVGGILAINLIGARWRARSPRGSAARGPEVTPRGASRTQ